MKNKKGQLGNLQSLIVVLIIVGLLLGAGFFILDEFLDLSNNIAVSVLNESDAYLNMTGYTLSNSTVLGFNTPVITAVWANSTGGAEGDGTPYLVPASNYTVSSVGVLTNATAAPEEAAYNDINVSYDYQRGSTSFIGVNQTITAMLTIPQLLGLIVLIAMIGIILAVIFGVIPGARVSGA